MPSGPCTHTPTRRRHAAPRPPAGPALRPRGAPPTAAAEPRALSPANPEAGPPVGPPGPPTRRRCRVCGTSGFRGCPEQLERPQNLGLALSRGQAPHHTHATGCEPLAAPTAPQPLTVTSLGHHGTGPHTHAPPRLQPVPPQPPGRPGSCPGQGAQGSDCGNRPRDPAPCVSPTAPRPAQQRPRCPSGRDPPSAPWPWSPPA